MIHDVSAGPFIRSGLSETELKEKAHEIFATCKRTWAGFIHDPDPRPTMSVPQVERLARYQMLYDRGGFSLWLGSRLVGKSEPDALKDASQGPPAPQM